MTESGLVIATVMGKRCLANIRRTAPLYTKQAEFTKTQDKVKKSKQSPPREKIFPNSGNASFTGGLNSGFPCKNGKRSNSPKKLPVESSISKRIRHEVVFRSPFKSVEQTNLMASKSQTTTSSPPKLSPRSWQSVEFRNTTRTKNITTVNIDQVESSEVKADFIDMDAGCETDKQNNKEEKREFHFNGDTLVEMQNTVNILSVNNASSSLNAESSCVTEAETGSTYIRSSNRDCAPKKSFQDEEDPLQNVDRPVIGKGCKLQNRRNMLSLRNKCTSKGNCPLADNQKNTGMQSATSDGDQISHGKHRKSLKDIEAIFKCPDQEQFHANSKKHSQTAAETETSVLQTVSPYPYLQDPKTTTSNNTVCHSVVLNSNFKNPCPRKIIELSQGSFPVGNRSVKIRASNLSMHGCARTLVCPRPIPLKRDIEDFVLKTSFKKFRRNMKTKN